jgi:hypothetical protein
LKIVIKKLIGTGNIVIKNIEIVRFENEIVISEIVFGIVHDNHPKDAKKINSHVAVPITRHWNY